MFSVAVLAQVEMLNSIVQALPTMSLISTLCGASGSRSSLADYLVVALLCFWIGILVGTSLTAFILSQRLRTATFAFASALASPQLREAAQTPARRRQARAVAYLDE